jgi:CheY-like chemotaxis protein
MAAPFDSPYRLALASFSNSGNMDESRELDILVVDDHESMRTIIAELLRAFGPARIREAENGETALRSLTLGPVDIVITDLKMPVLDGLGFVRRLRALEGAIARVPVIMVSGHANVERVCAARDAGVDEFIVKPINGPLLADRLRRIIHQQRPFVTSASYVGPCRRRRTAPDFRGPFRRDGDAKLVAALKAKGLEPVEA